MHSHKVIFNKTVTKLVTILTKCFFPYLNPTSYLNRKNCDFLKNFFFAYKLSIIHISLRIEI